MKPDFLPFCPHKLISLADMRRFGIAEFFVLEALCLSRKEQAFIAEDKTEEVTDKDKAQFENDLVQIGEFCKRMELKGGTRAIEHFYLKLKEKELPVFKYDVVHGFHTVYLNMGEDMVPLQFAFITLDKAEFFEQERLFGEKVFNRFKKAQYDIKEAGNCLATGANTACVFHLMRVAEHGLRALARRFDIELVNTTTRKPKPIEEATWQEIIDEVSLEIRNARNRATPAQEKRLEAYLHLNMACKAIKHLWRNPVSHLRGNYKEAKAKKIYGSVRDLMQNASTVLSGRR